MTILGPKTAVPTLAAAARMQHWAVILQAYNYQVEYRSLAEHANANALSRLPCDIRTMKEKAEMFFFSGLDKLPVDSDSAIARSYLWWPNLDAQIELMVKNCEVCQSVWKAPPRAPPYPWRWPTRVWLRVHIDFAEKDGNSFLGLVDSHSKWIEVAHMTSASAKSTIYKLRVWFAAYGLPEEVVSDNGPEFIASEFVDFLKQNGVKQKLVPPYQPSSNGAAERTVQIFKQA